MKQGFVYILTNFGESTLYIGVTGNLIQRIEQHKLGLYKGFTKSYKANRLVYYETYKDNREAIVREKQLKNWHRKWKINLINAMNPEMKDLSREIIK